MRYSNALLDGLFGDDDEDLLGGDQNGARPRSILSKTTDEPAPQQAVKTKERAVSPIELLLTNRLDAKNYGVRDPGELASVRDKKKTTINKNLDDAVLYGGLATGVSALANVLAGNDAEGTIENVIPSVRVLQGLVDGAGRMEMGADAEYNSAVRGYYDRVLSVDKANVGIDKNNAAITMKLLELQNKGKEQKPIGRYKGKDGKFRLIFQDNNGDPYEVASKEDFYVDPNRADDVIKQGAAFNSVNSITSAVNKEKADYNDKVAQLRTAKSVLKDKGKQDLIDGQISQIQKAHAQTLKGFYDQLNAVQQTMGWEITEVPEEVKKFLPPEDPKAGKGFSGKGKKGGGF